MLLLGRRLRQRRKLRLGLEVSHHPGPDIRQELQVVDLSRLEAGLVGIRSRTWTRGTVGTPPWSEPVEFIDRAEFWSPPLDRLFGDERD